MTLFMLNVEDFSIILAFVVWLSAVLGLVVGLVSAILDSYLSSSGQRCLKCFNVVFMNY